ncbi:hypothetical protein NUW58_g9258 [Xylaria curta]|uniref:Uncharacterized protein n=1 Tax=Xylaria curta TaxID=42375 RepID=A0ACC1MYH5_9PEZI|nr:hypothetical protein NUW58_g9258 [Xylaria curta]
MKNRLSNLYAGGAIYILVNRLEKFGSVESDDKVPPRSITRGYGAESTLNVHHGSLTPEGKSSVANSIRQAEHQGEVEGSTRDSSTEGRPNINNREPPAYDIDALTMLSPPGYFIWFNEPVPVPGTTKPDCYPPEFMEYYTTYHENPTTVGSLVPLMSPLAACPYGWRVVFNKGDYQACCPNGYDLTLPRSTLDPNRPAYGGTCYSEWPLSSSAYVEVFGSASSSGSIVVSASTIGFANYAHIIDGIAKSNSSPTPTTLSSSFPSPASTDSAQSGDSDRTSLAPGAIAGIVVGIVIALALLGLGLYLFARRRRQRSDRMLPTPPPKDEVALTGTLNSRGSPGVPPNHPAEIKLTQPSRLEMAADEPYVHELDAGHLPNEKP